MAAHSRRHLQLIVYKGAQQRRKMPARTDKVVLVCGLPGSGNRMIRDYVRSLGIRSAVWHGERYQDGHPVKHLPGCEGAKFYAIMPIRAAAARKLSHGKSEEYLCYRPNVLDWAARHPFLILSYEGFCMDPETACKEIAQLIGEKYRPCPFEVYGGTQRRLEEMQNG